MALCLSATPAMSRARPRDEEGKRASAAASTALGNARVAHALERACSESCTRARPGPSRVRQVQGEVKVGEGRLRLALPHHPSPCTRCTERPSSSTALSPENPSAHPRTRPVASELLRPAIAKHPADSSHDVAHGPRGQDKVRVFLLDCVSLGCALEMRLEARRNGPQWRPSPPRSSGQRVCSPLWQRGGRGSHGRAR